MTQTGRCLCRKATFAFDGPPAWSGYCHCESCRRNCSAPVTAFFGVPRGALRWTGEVPAKYQSSPGVHRHFCPHCGTPMAYDADDDTTNIHLYAASLDDPEAYTPTFHSFWNERLPWLALHDKLEKRGPDD